MAVDDMARMRPMATAVAPAGPMQAASGTDGGRGDQHLQSAKTEDGLAQRPEFRGLQFKADEEQHDDDAELGKMHDVLALAADEAEDGGADGHARDQIAEHGAKAEARGDGCGDHGGGEIDEGAEQKIGEMHRGLPP